MDRKQRRAKNRRTCEHKLEQGDQLSCFPRTEGFLRWETFTLLIGQSPGKPEAGFTPAGDKGTLEAVLILLPPAVPVLEEGLSGLDGLGVLEEKPAVLLELDTQAWPGNWRRDRGGAGEGGVLQPILKSCVLREETACVRDSAASFMSTQGLHWKCCVAHSNQKYREENPGECGIAKMTHHKAAPFYRRGNSPIVAC